HKEVKEFVANCKMFTQKNKIDKPIEYIFVTSNRIDKSAWACIKEFQKVKEPIKHKIIAAETI
ncbi:MAG: hypothetical protein LBC09_03005, partial [Helicobacteraceae bacterium]|nr:hypothetical protein [Helicobacteraceae bacterium]